MRKHREGKGCTGAGGESGRAARAYTHVTGCPEYLITRLENIAIHSYTQSNTHTHTHTHVCAPAPARVRPAP